MIIHQLRHSITCFTISFLLIFARVGYRVRREEHAVHGFFTKSAQLFTPAVAQPGRGFDRLPIEVFLIFLFSLKTSTGFFLFFLKKKTLEKTCIGFLKTSTKP